MDGENKSKIVKSVAYKDTVSFTYFLNSPHQIHRSIGGWMEKNKSKIVKTLAKKIQSVYLQSKQSTPDGSFNWWVDGENKSKIVKTVAYKDTVSLLTR